ncbi:hypothetical protein JTB14_004895 [Gonioctena quinquepunctata]|nr:hypothetical protein JTB14_004895 [Gonioctena quinquepunctata]
MVFKYQNSGSPIPEPSSTAPELSSATHGPSSPTPGPRSPTPGPSSQVSVPSSAVPGPSSRISRQNSPISGPTSPVRFLLVECANKKSLKFQQIVQQIFPAQKEARNKLKIKLEVRVIEKNEKKRQISKRKKIKTRPKIKKCPKTSNRSCKKALKKPPKECNIKPGRRTPSYYDTKRIICDSHLMMIRYNAQYAKDGLMLHAHLKKI